MNTDEWTDFLDSAVQGVHANIHVYNLRGEM